MERKTMGALIAALRKANGMTQRELAEKLNVSDKTVSRWERDDSTPELALIPVLAEIFGVTCDELLRGERRPPEERETAQAAESPKSGKQRQRLLAAGLSRYRTRSLISAGLAALAVTALAQAVVYNVWTDTELSPALEFHDVESFVEFMEREEFPAPYSGGGAYAIAPESATGERAWYDENGNEISEEEALTQTLRDENGGVICTYIARNRTAAYIRYGTGERKLPIRVVTYSALNVGRARRSLIGTGFLVLYGAEAAAAILVYAGKRKNDKIR